MGCNVSKQENDRDCVGASTTNTTDGLEAAEEVRYEIIGIHTNRTTPIKHSFLSLISKIFSRRQSLIVLQLFVWISSAKQSHLCYASVVNPDFSLAVLVSNPTGRGKLVRDRAELNKTQAPWSTLTLRENSEAIFLKRPASAILKTTSQYREYFFSSSRYYTEVLYVWVWNNVQLFQFFSTSVFEFQTPQLYRSNSTHPLFDQGLKSRGGV